MQLLIETLKCILSTPIIIVETNAVHSQSWNTWARQKKTMLVKIEWNSLLHYSLSNWQFKKSYYETERILKFSHFMTIFHYLEEIYKLCSLFERKLKWIRVRCSFFILLLILWSAFWSILNLSLSSVASQ